ncbi:amidase [Synergistales bacterium]|nr:amidase [Synergistales bacterium]
MQWVDLLLTLACCIAVLLLPRVSEAKTHVFKIAPEQAYNGMLESTIPPVLTIDDGDTVVFNTVMLLEGKLTADMTVRDLIALRKDIQERGNGSYAFTGPFYVNGAEPGDTLEIRIKSIVPGDWGVSYIYPDEMKIGGLPEGFREGWFKTLRYSSDKKTAEFEPGIVVKLRPFLGTMALAPRPGEKRPPAVPDYFAGNMDNKELIAGTTLFVPVNVPGGLFLAADAHGCQGDGEVCITASETWFESVELEFVVRKNLKLERPMAETPTHWIVMGFHADLNEAMKIALRDSIEFLMTHKKLSREEAYVLCSLAVDFRVTQIVDGNKGIHGMIPKEIFVKETSDMA